MKNRKRRRYVKDIKKNKRNRMGWLAFWIPCLIVLIAYISMGIFPFGEKAAMIIDSYHQYVPFFSELHDKIWHGDSLFYSWHGSLGFNFLALQAYYLASPLNLLIALFPASMMIEAFECLIVLKICLSGWTAYRYLRQRTGKNDYSTVIFAEFYALGGFTIAYNWNVMWLDSIVLFPLILMGVERLLQEGDGRLYTITLGLAIFCNYYMAIMICIFVVLYFFVVYPFGSRKSPAPQKEGEAGATFIKRSLHFAGCSLLAGGLAAIYLVPTYFTMINSSQGSKPAEFKLYRNFLELFRQQFALVEPTQLTGAPNIYCGVLLGMLIFFYIAAKNIRLREKLARLAVTAFLLVSLNVNVLDYIWHGLHFPNNLPGRFSFIYIFMIVVMAYDAWQSLRLTDGRLYILFFAADAVLFGLCLWFPEESLPLYSVIVTGVLMLVYMLLLAAHKRRGSLTIKGIKIRPRHICLGLLTLELAANSIYGLCMNGTVNRTNYTKDRAEVAAIREEYEAKDSFYRMELAQTRGRDDVTWHHLNGLSFFSSTADDRMEKLMGALGFYNSGNKYTYKGATPLTDAMLAIRYIISNDEMEASNLSLCEQTENKYIYENNQCLSLGFMVSAQAADWKIVEGDPFATQNDFVWMATSIGDDLFTPLAVPEPQLTGCELTGTDENKYFYDKTGSEGGLTWELTFEQEQDAYLYFEASHSENLKVTINGETETYSDQRGHIVHLGLCGPEDEVILEFPIDADYTTGNVKLQVYAFEETVFDNVYEELAENQLQVTDYDSTHLSGDIELDDGGLLMLSVPYDGGWTILVDGEKTEMIPVGEALTGCWLTAGNHHIEMRYIPQGFAAGAGITIVSVLILVWFWRKKVYRSPEKRKGPVTNR